MLFNSFPFLFAFLPLTLLVFFILGRLERRAAAIAFLVAASLFFYAWWLPAYLLVLVAEVCTNFFLGRAILEQRSRAAAKRVLIAAIVFNIGFLGYFKYTVFLVGIVDRLAGTDWTFAALILPLGISFHTFQQIAYLVDCHRGGVRRYPFMEYLLFVTFFPQLIAGPIVHHNEMMPQIEDSGFTRFRPLNFALGLSIFAVGLFKKTVIADQLAQIATPTFDAAAAGQPLAAGSAWLGAIAYTLQLYFDFSAYSDMALGLARMFNITLPSNFDSPYKAASIAEFWRRWHMTLSRFLRDFLYIPLGGNRRGSVRAAVNVMITMLLGGLWHGAGWTFVAWGGLHGLYIVIHRAWRSTGGFERLVPIARLRRPLGIVITMLAVIVAWVFFRAADFAAARVMLTGMFTGGTADVDLALDFAEPWVVVAIAAAIALLAPNVIDLFARFGPVLEVERANPRLLPPLIDRLKWQPSSPWGLALGLVLAVAAAAILGWQSEFLYFQF
jgi:D-alanyl-lipoteichoic acid acyltransferase DltB (MBOAT superfamily)